MHVLCAPDKFRGTATAPEVAEACARAAIARGHTATRLPLSDGGEGLLEALGGREQVVTVRGPLGQPVQARWRWLATDRTPTPTTAVIEMAEASGLVLAGGAAGNDPERASTRGTGEMILDAIEHGARRIIVGCGGSATTDGGLGAVELLAGDPRLPDVEIIAACDVTTAFVDAAAVFGRQKGADEAAIARLTERLRGIATTYADQFGVDVTALPGAGAAGGLGGGLAVLGASIRSGLDVVAEVLELDTAIQGADVVVTGEGQLDATSFSGKVVGEVLARSGRRPVFVITGDETPDAFELAGDVPVGSLVARFGAERAFGETLACIEALVGEYLDGLTPQ